VTAEQMVELILWVVIFGNLIAVLVFAWSNR